MFWNRSIILHHKCNEKIYNLYDLRILFQTVIRRIIYDIQYTATKIHRETNVIFDLVYVREILNQERIHAWSTIVLLQPKFCSYICKKTTARIMIYLCLFCYLICPCNRRKGQGEVEQCYHDLRTFLQKEDLIQKREYHV